MADGIQNFGAFDAFEDADEKTGDQSKVHIRVQQRNGRKCITTARRRVRDVRPAPAAKAAGPPRRSAPSTRVSASSSPRRAPRERPAADAPAAQVQGLADDLDVKRICKAFKKNFQCNGAVTKDSEMGEIIQLSGDQRTNVNSFLVEQEICLKSQVVIHGF